MSCEVCETYSIDKHNLSDYILYSDYITVCEKSEGSDGLEIEASCPFEPDQGDNCIFHSEDSDVQDCRNKFNSINSDNTDTPLLFIDIEFDELHFKNDLMKCKSDSKIELINCTLPCEIESTDGKISIHKSDINITLSQFKSISLSECDINRLEVSDSRLETVNILGGRSHYRDIIRSKNGLFDELDFDLEIKLTEFATGVNFAPKESGKVKFIDVTFDSQACFNLEGLAEFNRATFKNRADFSGLTEGLFIFKQAEFEGNANFRGVEGDFIFDSAIFKSHVDFSPLPQPAPIFPSQNAWESPRTDFMPDQFSQREKWIDRPTILRSSQFHKAEFEETVNFRKVKFIRSIDLTKTKFKAGANFTNSTISDVNIKGNLQDAILDGCNVTNSNLHNADLQNIQINPNTNFFKRDLSVYAKIIGIIATHLLRSLDFIYIFSDKNFKTLNDYLSKGADLSKQIDKYLLGRSKLFNRNNNSYTYQYNLSFWAELIHNNYKTENIKENIDSLDDVRTIYRQIELSAKQYSIPSTQSVAFINRKNITKEINKQKVFKQNKILDKIISIKRYASLKLQDILFTYGENPWKLTGWSTLTIFIFSIIYSIMRVTSGVSLENVISTYTFTLLYSTSIFFTGSGRSIIQLNSKYSNILLTAESILGVIFIALLIFTITRSVSR